MGHLFVVVKIAGALYLIYLGYKYWTAPVTDVADEPVDARRGFLAQFALAVGNPKAIAFWCALVPAVVDLRSLNFVIYLQLALACITITPLIMAAYAALASRVRGFLTSIKARRRINKGAAAVMVGAGVGVAVS
jgi:threonine/homoserine/homoserine lactone efflux protein